MSYFASTKDFGLEVAQEKIIGKKQAGKFGRLTNIDTGDTFPKDLWNGDAVYTGFPTGAAETIEVFSSSANDTSGGTGGRLLRLHNLLDGDGNAMPAVDITLNGTTPVSAGAQTYSRCSRAMIHEVGSTGSNEGEITIRHSTTTANVFAVMPIGFNATHIMAYTVPAGQTLYVHRGYVALTRAAGNDGSAAATVQGRVYGESAFISRRLMDITHANPYKYENNGYMIFTARTDLKVSVNSVSDNDTIISSEYDGYLVAD